MTIRVGFIGAGNMATAMMDGLILKGVCRPDDIICSDLYEPSLEKARNKGVQVTDDNLVVCQHSPTAIIIAVKPNAVAQVCADIRAYNTTTTTTTTSCIISIAAGISLDDLQDSLPHHRVVRVMPNTPCLVGMGAAGYSMGSLTTDEDRTLVSTLFGSFGIAVEVPEYLLHAVTGLSGSGPAFVFPFIEALADGGVRAGLTREVAQQLAAQTVKGAAEMVLTTGIHPGALKDMVASPGGTTIAGVQKLEEGNLRATAISAVMAAAKRSMQLGGESEKDIRYKYNMD
jgi:pyrroline-5-carboxylate reductase